MFRGTARSRKDAGPRGIPGPAAEEEAGCRGAKDVSQRISRLGLSLFGFGP